MFVVCVFVVVIVINNIYLFRAFLTAFCRFSSSFWLDFPRVIQRGSNTLWLTREHHLSLICDHGMLFIVVDLSSIEHICVTVCCRPQLI